jgi:hypothetical protein
MVSGKPKNDILFWFELKTQNNWKSFGLKPKIIGSLLENQKRFEAEIKTKRARNLNSALHGGAQPVPKLWRREQVLRSFLFLFLDASWLTISFFRIARYSEHGKNCPSKETKSTFIRRLQNYGLDNRCFAHFCYFYLIHNG